MVVPPNLGKGSALWRCLRSVFWTRTATWCAGYGKLGLQSRSRVGLLSHETRWPAGQDRLRNREHQPHIEPERARTEYLIKSSGG
jgi:hypothetical protein